jgi:hypothetical protein
MPWHRSSPVPSKTFFSLTVLAILTVAILGYFASAVSFDPIPDESWMVLVTSRLAAGEQLYQDIFCGVTPLSFQLQGVLQSAFGASIAVLRAINYALFAATLFALLAAGIALRFSRIQFAVLLCAAVVWAAPVPSSVYSAWAVLFSLMALYCALRLVQTPFRLGWGAAAGLCAGLAFSSKQNIGLLCLAALLAGLFGARPRKAWRAVPAVMTLFLLAAVLPLLPTLLSGAFPGFFRMGFSNKTVYLQTAGLPYLNYVHLTPFALWQHFGLLGGTLLWSRFLLYLAPAAALASLGLGRKLLAPHRAALRLQLVFAAAAVAFVYPRPDAEHILLCAPFLALVLVSLLPVALTRAAAQRLLAIPVAAAAILQFYSWCGQLQNPLPASTPSIPAFASLRLSPAFAARAAAAASLASGTRQSRVLILDPQAATLYLASGLENPTLYDYPLRSAFGPKGQQEVIDQIRSGLIPAVCLSDSSWEGSAVWRPFPPEELIAFVHSRMTPAEDAGICRIYLPSTTPFR